MIITNWVTPIFERRQGHAWDKDQNRNCRNDFEKTNDKIVCVCVWGGGGGGVVIN